MFTPSDRKARELLPEDRPFAGALLLSVPPCHDVPFLPASLDRHRRAVPYLCKASVCGWPCRAGMAEPASTEAV